MLDECHWSVVISHKGNYISKPPGFSKPRRFFLIAEVFLIVDINKHLFENQLTKYILFFLSHL